MTNRSRIINLKKSRWKLECNKGTGHLRVNYCLPNFWAGTPPSAIQALCQAPSLSTKPIRVSHLEIGTKNSLHINSNKLPWAIFNIFCSKEVNETLYLGTVYLSCHFGEENISTWKHLQRYFLKEQSFYKYSITGYLCKWCMRITFCTVW